MSKIAQNRSWLIKYLWGLPVVLMIGIYLPGSIFAAFLYRDKYSFSLLAVLGIFILSFYIIYPWAQGFLAQKGVENYCLRIGDCIRWRMLALLSLVIYSAVLIIAISTTETTPLGAAISGGSWLDISRARGNLFANREGYEAILRYLALIFGRYVIPLMVVYLFWIKSRYQKWALLALLLCYLISLEKGAAIFALTPLILLSLTCRRYKEALIRSLLLMLFIGIATFLSSGPFVKNIPMVSSNLNEDFPAIKTFNIGLHGDIHRHFIFDNLAGFGIEKEFEGGTDSSGGRINNTINRIIWTPTITAYDWLKFHDEVLGGKLTMGSSISGLHWVLGVEKLPLEKMVYEYQFGPPPGGAGASNTVFLVDAKLAFGWFGVILYSILFAFFSAVIFSSHNLIVKISSITTFFTATVSPLTATLLSGGLIFYMAMALFWREPNSRG